MSSKSHKHWWSASAKPGCISAKWVEVTTMFVQLGQYLVGSNPNLADVKQSLVEIEIWSNSLVGSTPNSVEVSAKFGLTLSKLGWLQSQFGRCQAKFGQIHTKCSQIWYDLRQIVPSSSRLWLNQLPLWSKSARFWSSSGRIRQNAAQTWSKSTQIRWTRRQIERMENAQVGAQTRAQRSPAFSTLCGTSLARN